MLILVADPDPVPRSALLAHFRDGGYEVWEESNLDRLAATVHSVCPDLVLLAWPNDQGQAQDLLQWLEGHRIDVTLVVLSDTHDAATAIACLEAGADDYLRRPIDPRELEARIRALKRRGRQLRDQMIKAGPVAIDDRCKRVTVYGAEIQLSPKEYLLLRLCAGDPGRVFSHEEITDRLWPERGPADAVDIKQYVHLLRTKLGKVPKGRNLIENVKGFGYRLSV